MASWTDFIGFILILSAFVGAIVGVRYAVKQISSAVSATKESLRDRGYTISDKGVSIRTSSRFNREDYVDATQRGFIKAMNAASFSKAENNLEGKEKREGKDGGYGANLEARRSAPVLSRHDSSASVKSTGSGGSGSGSRSVLEKEKEKKRYRFGLRKRNADSDS